jgi:hypothetical protein
VQGRGPAPAEGNFFSPSPPLTSLTLILSTPPP